MLLGDAPHNCPVPLVTVSPSGEDGGAPFEPHLFSTTYLKASDVCVNNEIPYIIAVKSLRNVSQHFMEEVKLASPRLILYDAPILTQTSKLEFSGDAWDDDKGSA